MRHTQLLAADPADLMIYGIGLLIGFFIMVFITRWIFEVPKFLHNQRQMAKTLVAILEELRGKGDYYPTVGELHASDNDELNAKIATMAQEIRLRYKRREINEEQYIAEMKKIGVRPT